MANQENIRKWVEALRSGTYAQTIGRLADNVGFCCLGVACEVAIANGVALSKRQTESLAGTFEYAYGPEWSEGELPDIVAEWLGFYDEGDDEYSHATDPSLPTTEHPTYSCASWNDEAKATFSKIADLIEAHYLTPSVKAKP